MFIKRTITPLITAGAQQSPVIAIIGPRQSGKSTLSREIFSKHTYIDMQDAEMFDFANEDPKGFLKSYANDTGIIIDEAQYAPKLFPQIKVEADKNAQPGYFVLSGSQNFLLHEKISESLAGRVYFYTLLPFSIAELQASKLLSDRVEDQVIKGFYPKVYQPAINAQEYYDNYISTYVERDIRSIKNIENLFTFRKFMQLCALRIGSILNVTDLATNCGISINTAKSWLSLLETSFVLFLLPSYHNNFGKRITKSPKLYFYDVGLALALMNIDKEMLIKKRDLYGSIFENMIIADIMKNLNARSAKYTLTFFRDTNQNEVDLIIETEGKIIPVEIKASESISSSFFDTLTWFKEQTNSPEEAVVVYGGDKNQTRTKGKVISWKNTDEIV